MICDGQVDCSNLSRLPMFYRVNYKAIFSKKIFLTITITNSLFRHMKIITVFLLYNLAIIRS